MISVYVNAKQRIIRTSYDVFKRGYYMYNN